MTRVNNEFKNSIIIKSLLEIPHLFKWDITS